MSDAVTTALLAPVALALAQTLGHPTEACAATVAVGAIVCLLAPLPWPTS